MTTQARAGVYYCRQAAQCLSSVPSGDTGRHRFAVGTCALQQRNEIHIVDFLEETAEVSCRQVLQHDDEVSALTVNPADARQLLTFASGKCTPALRLWQISDPDAQEASLQMIASFADDETPLATLKRALWDTTQKDQVVAIDAEAVHVFQQGTAGVTRTLSLDVSNAQRCFGGCLDPHHAQQISTVDGPDLKTWDLKSSKIAFKKDGAHLFGARDVDYNPNIPYQVVTTGDDAVVRFWDLRHLDKPLKALTGGHHHWIVRASYNSHHDQLILTCGTDSAVCLWRAPSVASRPLGNDEGEEAKEPVVDGLIRRYEEHEDSCYSCTWSNSDPWIFASVSYDGKVVVNRVPSDEKYRILL
mmetsp:Transcript_56871/g.133634  ORF Transcript_56871/g.133634 Transcript_56871/m.133634 type:complete len:358 (-) Transcript_56871:120-1193(-)